MTIMLASKKGETSPLPVGWEVKKLRDLCTQIQDGTHFTPTYVEYGIPFYSVENVTARNFENCKFITPSAHEAMAKRCRPIRGDILMTRIGSIGDTCLVTWDHECSIYVSLVMLRPSKAIDPRYLYAYSRSQAFVAEVESHSLPNAIPKKINLRDIGDVEVAYPTCRSEQQAIAEALSDADALIEGLERLIAKKRLIKQGAMQDLLTAKRRLPGFSGEWSEVTVSGCARISRIGCNPISEPEQVFEHYSLPAFDAGPAPTFEKGKEIQSNKFRVTEDTLLVSKLNPRIPRVWTPSVSSDRAVCSTEFMVLIPNEGVERDFLSQVFLSPQMIDEMTYRATGTTGSHQRIAPSTFAGLKIYLPCQEEQQMIAEALGDMDAEIQALETRLDKARLVKEGMMQNLLTGRIRLV